MTMHEAGHLGGYIIGGDEATQYPDLWRWLVSECGVQTVLDVGCGDGQAVNYFLDLGVDAIGVDGVPQEHDHIFQHDYTAGPLYFDRKDLVWSCEFVEHVEEQYVPNFLETFKVGQMLLMTHAEPGQPGWHHVNCQPATYWIEKLTSIGFHYDHGLTLETRLLAARNENPWNHYRRSGLAFLRP